MLRRVENVHHHFVNNAERDFPSAIICISSWQPAANESRSVILFPVDGCRLIRKLPFEEGAGKREGRHKGMKCRVR